MTARIVLARRRLRPRIAADEAGALSVEYALVAPVLLAVVLLLVAAGRIGLAETDVRSAASAAAREASLALTAGAAQVEATDTALASLDRSGYTCVELVVVVDGTGLGAALGEPGTVTATVTCVLSLGDVALPGLGGTRTFTATASSPVDPFRERGVS